MVKVKFDKYLKEKEIPHRYYGSEIKLWNVFAFLFKYYNYIKKLINIISNYNA